MLTLFIAFIVGIATGIVSAHNWGSTWGIIFGAVAVMIVQLAIGLIVRKKINGVNLQIQEIMTEAQKHINRKVRAFQQKPQSSHKAIQKILEKDQYDYIRKVIEKTDDLKRYSKWNLLMNKQISTMKLIYHYQLREFDKVDELLASALYFDPRAVAIKIARMFKRDEKGIDKFFARKVKKFKGDNATIIYALYSWILVKREKYDDAIKVLVEAKARTGNQVIAANWEAIANGNHKQFSNANLGDEWYSLYLEEPRIKTQKQRRAF